MRRRVLLARLHVLPGPRVVHHPLERGFEVARHGRIRMLVDRHARGRVRHVHEHRRAPLASDRVAHRAGDVEDVAPTRCPQPDLAHVELESAAGRRGAPASSGFSRLEARLKCSSMFSRLSLPRSTTASSSVIDATSSRCSCRNQCRNCSPTSSPSSRALLHERHDLVGDALLLVEREPYWRHDVGELGPRRLDAGRDDVLVCVQQVLHHHHRVVPLLHRLPVEVGGELRERLRVVIHRHRDVLLRGRELIPDLIVESCGERWHARDSNAAVASWDGGCADDPQGPQLHTRRRGSTDELATVLDLADELKAERLRRRELRLLPGRTIGLIFHKPSTRTRVAFEVGIAELGGMALFLPASELQLARGESYRDTALVLSRFLSALMIRTFAQAEVETFAEHASIPVINGLTDQAHPLQALADAMTLRERFGSLAGVRLAYVGDGNNVCNSLMRIAARFGMQFLAATPAGYEPRPELVAAARADAEATGGSVELVTDPIDAARGAQALYTDVWASMGQDDDRERRLRDRLRTASTASCSRSPARMPSRSTASPLTRTRRSLPRSSTAPAASRGSKRRTGCTRRRRSWLS